MIFDLGRLTHVQVNAIYDGMVCSKKNTRRWAGSSDQNVAIWLTIVALMVASMVVIGGITRVTGSGLSMVEWRPLLGWLPPLDDREWGRIFKLYQTSPEYSNKNKTGKQMQVG